MSSDRPELKALCVFKTLPFLLAYDNLTEISNTQRSCAHSLDNEAISPVNLISSLNRSKNDILSAIQDRQNDKTAPYPQSYDNAHKSQTLYLKKLGLKASMTCQNLDHADYMNILKIKSGLHRFLS